MSQSSATRPPNTPDEINLHLPRYNRHIMPDYRQPGSTQNVSRERKMTGEFIPYVQERDALGNLLPRQSNSCFMSSFSFFLL